MNRHAYLIIAHNSWEQLKFLISVLDDVRNDIYLHIDIKATDFDRNAFEKIAKLSKLYFVERTNVIWGDYSQIRSELVLLEAATKNGPYKYYHLLSGIDMPVKSQDDIHAFFDEESYEFLEYVDFDDKSEASRRTRYHYFLQNKVGKSRDCRTRKFREKIVGLEKRIGINRSAGFYDYLGKGANWFSITEGFAQYVIDNLDFVKKHFKNTICADEVFLHTLLKKSPFKDNWYGFYDKDIKYQNMRYTDWERGNPYVFDKDDFFELTKSQYMFARKFDERIICDEVKEFLCKTSHTTEY
ncbi:beta-1,6-N-acetylglucosaminyltransferase [Butyrivibrio sp. VCB2001]|uniref:beta-1,6-N-acetylglucosaminyltransferase n=1 Tax=Butyrivibrio sp. VCB2001 TaxID=1280667 RepID=UPI0003FD76D0|nr:beta-1,6-N-acetylglucosaminyltransferase [Butyrivibrio sp. VCB2001]